MRPLLLVLAGLCASTTTSLAVWAAISLEPTATPAPYCELLRDTLIRTNLPDRIVKRHVADVLNRVAREDPAAEAPLHEHTYEIWFSEPDVWGSVQEQASQNRYQLAGVEGAELGVRVVRDAKSSAMIFFEHDSPGVVRRVARRLATRLQIEATKNG